MNTRPIIGVMGGGVATDENLQIAYRLGKLIAQKGWILLNGGRRAGIMDASARGAREAGGITLGILPDADRHQVSPHIDIAVLTGMGNARNCINVLTSHVVVACTGGAGTLSEIALALKCGRRVILLNFKLGEGLERYQSTGQLSYATTPEDAIEQIQSVLLSPRLFDY